MYHMPSKLVQLGGHAPAVSRTRAVRLLLHRVPGAENTPKVDHRVLVPPEFRQRGKAPAPLPEHRCQFVRPARILCSHRFRRLNTQISPRDQALMQHGLMAPAFIFLPLYLVPAQIHAFFHTGLVTPDHIREQTLLHHLRQGRKVNDDFRPRMDNSSGYSPIFFRSAGERISS